MGGAETDAARVPLWSERSNAALNSWVSRKLLQFNSIGVSDDSNDVDVFLSR